MPRSNRIKRIAQQFKSRRHARAHRRRQRRVLFRALRVEPLESRLLLAADFGDAPLPYPVTSAEIGASHTVGTLQLGATVDMEADGAHSANADADGADEDGVTFGTMQVGQLGAAVTVNVQGAAGKLDAWIDFNGDGSWGGPGEQIFASRDVGTGDNNLTFDVPSYAIAGTTYARFRLSTAGGLGVGGAAADGEVEDYQVVVGNPAAASGTFNPQTVVSTSANGPRSVFAADVDGDGDMDVLSASSFDDKIAWYENDGSQNFTAHTISTAADGLTSVFAADVDGDGDLDVLSASFYDDKIAWYENDGSQTFTARTISTAADRAPSVFAADVDGDGDIDVLSASLNDDKIAWYENDGSQNFTAHTISTAADAALSVFAADVDGDGDLDVLSASFNDDKIAWYENDGSQNFTERTISTAADGARSVFAADVDGDGDLDVLSGSGNDNKIAWYENDGSQNFTPHTISTTADSAFSVFAADVDGDGDLDVLSASYFDNKIAWYENDGSQNFTERTISTAAAGAYSVFVADVDGDGDLDVLSASNSYGDNKIAWYENTAVVVVDLDFGDAPAPYPTLVSEGGAAHAATGLTLGAERDFEADGVHSTAADGDDTTGSPDDEDGVTFGSMQVGQLGATVTVNVQGAAGKLDAWIDFNGDGSWGGPGEQIFASQNVAIGDNNLTFDVPSYAIAGTTFARFRLSTAGGLGVGGAAADGEVEDYQVAVGNPGATSGTFNSETVVTTGANGAVSVFAADVDGDGDMDMLSASRYDDKIAWYENDGSQNFTAHTISTAADGARSVFAADVDGDGDLDVLSASFRDDKIAWYENDGSQNFTAHTISTAANGAFSVFAADVDGDGDLDVLSASAFDDKIAWYENDGNQNFTAHTISTAADSAKSVFAADVDGDGDLDVLSASSYDDKIAWYENDGSQNFTARTISTTDGAVSVFAADVDGDGDLDVLSASYFDDKIAWYENDGSQTFTARTISTAVDLARNVFAADVDGDGDLDVLSASYNDDKIAWYENDGSQTFTARTISTAADGAVSVFAADVDGDGDLDVLSASQYDDKIAWYENVNPIAADFGDAPTPYPTTSAENGAAHAATGLTLGATRDSEVDGTHSANADFDDLNGTTPDDEDGVTFGSMQVGQLGATVTVNVQGAAGKLDAWIDFNGDGSWGGPGEQIFAARDVALGDNILTFDVPSYAIAGTTYARFRLSTAGGLGVGGAAADGEVEDYQVVVGNPGATSGTFNPQTVVSTTADNARSVFAADVDGDGDMDMLSASVLDDKIAWYENDGSQNFTAHTISTAADFAYSVFAADVDGDGDLDVLSASVIDDKIAWYENDGSQNFTPHTISTAADSARSVFAADVDGDGDMDMLSASVNDDKIAWYENDGSQNFTERVISTAADAARSVFAADVDGDGDMDMLSASVNDDKIAWYENDGSQNFTERTISTAANGATSVFAADVDGDGDLDVLSASYSDDKIAWYENDGSQNFTERTISTAADFARSVFAADVDGDGDLDVLSASQNDNKIAWYENDGSQNFTAHTISTAADGAFSVFAADVDGDGDLDVLSASQYDDKIAWYENVNPIAADFGDAPTPYPTTSAENGAAHAATGLTLGATRDSEVDGTHSANADFDDLNGTTPDDEDGVTFGSMQVGQLGATVTVNVQGAAGKLDAWIDFNGDGSWGGPGEQIFAARDVALGDNNLTFDVPSFAIAGTTYARFRLSTAGGLGVGGAAADGEVEDYQVTVGNPAAAGGVFGGQNTISTAADGLTSVFAADVDGDGDLDVLSASQLDDKIAWYENDGSQNFTAHTISTAADSARSVFAADVDGDGDLDVLSASAFDGKIAWYENDGSQNFTAHTISTAADRAQSVFAADVDGDGDMDVLSASVNDDKIAWYENDGSQNFTAHTISTAADGAQSVFAADVDGDGDLDVLSASQLDDKIAWYENDGSQNFTAHTISTAVDGARSVFAADVDGDGDLDVLSASANDDKIAWYENDGSQNFTAHTISTAADFAYSVFAADVDGDGDLDVLSASANDDKIAWYENDGSQNFTPHTISTAADGARSVFAADVDGDGDLDVLSASTLDDKIAWYENTDSDFGDAPSSYPTTEAENGARHTAVGPTLGANRDLEGDGTHSAAADFDDLNGATPDDEDGVTFGSMQVGQLGATVTVNVQGAAGKLDAWIDFNGDGSWGGPGEQIFAARDVALGDNNLTFDVPSYAIAGTTFARFRLSTAGGLGVGGAAADGEVEDYQVTVGNPAAAGGVFGGQNTISTAANSAQSVFAADVDGDGDMDMLSASANDDKIAWYENDGSQNFTEHTISTAADHANSVFAADVDGDGDLDVLSASLDDDKIAWYENDGSQNFTEHTISTTADGPISVFAADVDGDGDLDVLSASFFDGKIAWYENAGSQNFTERTISTAAVGALSVFAADVDGDGDLDVLSASYNDDKIAWYENDGSQNFTERTISTAVDGAFSVFATDVDDDGDLDVLSASYNDNRIAWYENDGSQNFTERTISTAAFGAQSVFAADVDGDGDLDVLSASFADDKIAWYENDGSQNFTEHTISTAADGAYSVFAADVDGDGDLDVLSASSNDNKIAWYENTVEVDTDVTLAAGMLTITDVMGGTSNDDLTISYSGGVYTITDGGGLLIGTAIAGATGNGTDTVTIPDTGVTSIVFDTLGGDDSITVTSVQASLPGGFTINDGTGVDRAVINADIDTGAGNVSITVSQDIAVTAAGSITTSSGNVTLTANQGATQSTGNFAGVTIAGSLSTVDGDILLVGRSGDAGSGTFGVNAAVGASITSTGTGAGAGTITMNGVGFRHGVVIQSPVQTVDGAVNVTGVSESEFGAYFIFSGLISSTGTGANAATITIDGTSNATSGSFEGVRIINTGGAGTGATSVDGDISITGNAPGRSGIGVFDGPVLQASGAANITLMGTGSGFGMTIRNSTISAIDGDISLTGVGGDSFGVQLLNDATISSTGTGPGAGTITIDGTSNAASGSFEGVRLQDTVATTTVSITSVDGDISITGNAPVRTGIGIYDSPTVQASGAANITLMGTGGSLGMVIRSSAINTTAGGDITLTGIGNSASDISAIAAFLVDSGPAGTLTLNANTIEISGSGGGFAGSGDLIIQPRDAATSIGLGGGAGTLNLTDAELAVLVDGFSSITIGDTAAAITARGNVNINTAIFTDPVTIAGNAIHDLAGTDIDAGTNTVTLDGIVSPGQSPGVLTVTGNFAFGAAATLDAEIMGTTPGVDHDQIAVTGTVDINNATLNIDDTDFTAVGNETYVLIDNDGADAVTGTFNGLPEGTMVTVGSKTFQLSYVGGTGNDVVLAVAGADLVITKTDSPDPVVAGNQLTYTITVMNNGPIDANDVVVTDTLPAGVSNAMTAGCAEDPTGTPTCSLGTITAGNSTMFTITVDVDAGTTGIITNMASASSSTPLTNTGDDSVSIDTTVFAPPITVIVTKHADTDDGVCDADCSLREAVIATNAHVTPAGPNTILFDAGLDGTPIMLTMSGTDNTSALGDLDISGALVIQGNGARKTIIDAQGVSGLGDRVIHILPGADVTIDGVEITGGDSNAQGAGIRNAGTLTLVESAVSGNDANTQGGGVFSNGTATIVSSLISGNTAGGRGGGLYGSDVTIANSTISGNTATGNGGGIYNDGNLTAANLTIASNSGASGGGIFNNGSMSIDNSIITLSTGGDCAGGGTAGGMNNRSDDASCVGNLGAVTGFDPTLADNGGATDTHALQSGSNAIDAGDNGLVPADSQDLDGDMDTAEPLFFDQRGLGFARIVDGGGGATVDIGAFELVPYTAQIADDDAPIFSAGGFTRLASMSNPHGFAGPDGIQDEYYSAANSGNMATWTFTVTPGVYRVSANWTPHANRATNSPFSVFDGPAGGSPVQSTTVNQELAPDDFTDGGAAWEDLFERVVVTGNTLAVKLSDTPANGFVIADGMRIERILGPEIGLRDVDGKKAVSSGGTVDLGFVVTGSTVTRDFRILNSASNDLEVSNVSISPSGSAFSLNPDPNPVAAIGFDGSTDFTIELDTSTAGLQQATVTIASNDPAQPSFTFDLTATVGAKRIIDNGDAGFAASKFTGIGAGFTGPPQGYQNDIHYHAAATPGFAAAKWIFGGLEPGTYQVSVTWNEHANRSNQSSFTISGTTSDGTVQVNQRQAPSSFAGAFTDEAADWAPLNVGGSGGNFTLSGSTLTVTLGTNAFGYVIADAVRIEKLSMLRAESAAAPSTDGSAAAAVRTADATALLDKAIAHWSSVDRAAAARLAGVSLQVADLPGDVLGLASAGQNRIWLDTDAAGHGWQINRKSQIPNLKSIDLLSVVTHELGHVLGLPDLDHIEYPTNIMAGRLAAGTRRLPDLAPNERIDPIAWQRDWLFADFGRDEYSLESEVADQQLRDESQASVARRSSSTSRLTAQRMDDDVDSLNIETRSSEQTEEDVLDAMFAALTEEFDI